MERRRKRLRTASRAPPARQGKEPPSPAGTAATQSACLVEKDTSPGSPQVGESARNAAPVLRGGRKRLRAARRGTPFAVAAAAGIFCSWTTEEASVSRAPSALQTGKLCAGQTVRLRGNPRITDVLQVLSQVCMMQFIGNMP